MKNLKARVYFFFAAGGWSIGLFYFESELRLFFCLRHWGQWTCPPSRPRKPSSGLIDGKALPRGQTLERRCLCWHFKPSFSRFNDRTFFLFVFRKPWEWRLVTVVTSSQRFGAHRSTDLWPINPNCNIPSFPPSLCLAEYSGQSAGGRGHEFEKVDCFLYSATLTRSLPPSLPLTLTPPSSQYGDIHSLTVSTRVHLCHPHNKKRTKTTDVFLNLELCIKTCLLFCMFLCCREVETCPVTPLSLSRSRAKSCFWIGATTDRVFVSRNSFLSFRSRFKDAGWELHGTRQAPGQRESAALITTTTTSSSCSLSDSYKLCPQTFYKPHVHYL